MSGPRFDPAHDRGDADAVALAARRAAETGVEVCPGCFHPVGASHGYLCPILLDGAAE